MILKAAEEHDHHRRGAIGVEFAYFFNVRDEGHDGRMMPNILPVEDRRYPRCSEVVRETGIKCFHQYQDDEDRGLEGVKISIADAKGANKRSGGNCPWPSVAPPCPRAISNCSSPNGYIKTNERYETSSPALRRGDITVHRGWRT